jgi:ABC-type phosphate transport system permease subunit
MPTPRAEDASAVGSDAAPSDVQLTRAFIAVVIGVVFGFFVLKPICSSSSVRTLLPELRVLAGVPSLVI